MMKDIEVIQDLIVKYQTLHNKDDYYIEEVSYLNLILKDLEWDMLTAEQKQVERRERNEMLLSKLYKDSDDVHIKYETKVIDLYDTITKYSLELEPFIQDDPYILRLYSVLIIEKTLINKHRRIFNIKHVNIDIVNQGLALQNNNSIDLTDLQSAFDEMYKLLPQTPYRL